MGSYGERERFVCGTRAVVKAGSYDYRVVCATCGAEEGNGSKSLRGAKSEAIRNSGRPCPAKPPCGAR